MNRYIFFRIVWALFLIAVAVGVGLLAYNAGVARGLADSGKLVLPPAGTAPYSYPYGAGPFFHSGFFGPGLGLLNCLAVLAGLWLIFGLLRLVVWRPHWGWGGPHGAWSHEGKGEPHHWRGPWGKGFPPMFEEWHRQAHGQGTDQTTPPSEPNKA